MHLKLETAVISFLLVMALWQPLGADEVTMKNGDRISGEIIRMENGMLTIKPSYAGELSLQWEEVASMTTDATVKVLLEDDSALHGRVTGVEAGKLRLEAAAFPEPLQFSTDRVTGINPPSPPLVTFKGRVNVGMDVKKGNTDTEAYYGDGELVARTDKNRYAIGGEINQEEESGQETADNWMLYMMYDHFLTQKWFIYTKAGFEQDDFKDLNLRTTLGAGSGYQFFESAKKNLAVRGGLAYVSEDYSVEGQDEDYSAGLWQVEYDHFLVDRLLQFFHHHQGTVSLEDSEDLLIQTRTGLRIPLSKGFNTTFQYNWDWDNAPTPGTDRVDERYLFTLGYSWE